MVKVHAKSCIVCGQRFDPTNNRAAACSLECRITQYSRLGPNGCIEWAGSRRAKGYGEINVGGTAERAHRVAWELANGPIPEGMLLLHSCDNPPCINVDHLRLGSASENTADMLKRSRARVGDQCSWTKIPEGLLPEIKRRVAAGPRGTMALIARELGVSHSAISDIIRGEKRTRSAG